MKRRYRDRDRGCDWKRRRNGNGGRVVDKMFPCGGISFKSPWVNTPIPHFAMSRLFQKLKENKE